jgi:hypothetical protein
MPKAMNIPAKPAPWMAARGTNQLSALSVGKNGRPVMAPNAPLNAMVWKIGNSSDGTNADGSRVIDRRLRPARACDTAKVRPPRAMGGVVRLIAWRSCG